MSQVTGNKAGNEHGIVVGVLKVRVSGKTPVTTSAVSADAVTAAVKKQSKPKKPLSFIGAGAKFVKAEAPVGTSSPMNRA